MTRDLTGRLDALEAAVRSLNRDEITKVATAVREPAGGDVEWAPDRRFWFDGTADLTLTRDEEGAIRELWTRMNAGLVFAVTGREVGAWIDRPGVLARLDRIGPRGRQVEGAAATILEREMGGEVWLGAIGIWNALCAGLLEDRISAALRADLTGSWRAVRPSHRPPGEP